MCLLESKVISKAVLGPDLWMQYRNPKVRFVFSHKDSWIKNTITTGNFPTLCRQHIEKQRHYFANKSLSSQSYGFSSGHVWIWDLEYEESWAPKNWCLWTVVLEKTLESPLDCKEIQPIHPKGDQSWIFIGKTDAEAETPILWPPDVKNWLIGKDPGCWERLKAGGEGDDREWDGWMASPTQWTWVWVNSGSWWWTGKPGVLWSVGLQSRTRLSYWTELYCVNPNPETLFKGI